MASWWAELFILSALLPIVSSLECYSCEKQENNKDKCIKTTMQCDQNQDTCMTDIQWGIPPYWRVHGDRVPMITKTCSTNKQCNDKRKEKQSACKRDWYLDWWCVECCTGDMCNYYVTMGASQLSNSLMLLLTGLLTLTLTWSHLCS